MAVPHRPNASSAQYEILGAEFDSYIEKVLSEFKIPGASVAVVRKDRIETKGYGVRYIDGPVVTTQTLFNAASMSKSFTAASIGLLVDDTENFPGVTWNTPFSTLLREDFVLPDSYANEHCNAIDVLSHRHGFFGHDAADHGPHAKVPDTPRSVTRKLRHLRMNKPFRTEFQYNNQMYTAASYLVEVLTKIPFYTFLRSRFWDPLQMNRTISGTDVFPNGKAPPEDLQTWSRESDIALGHFYDKDSASYKLLPYPNEPEGQGAGNIVSTAGDFAKWIQSMMYCTNALRPETIHELTRPRILSSDNERNLGDRREPLHSPLFYGMGWNIEWYRGHKCADHSGGIPGFTSVMRYLPEHKFGVVLFGNSAGMGDASEVISWKLIDDFLGVPESERMDWVQRMRAPDPEDEEDKGPYPDRADPPLPLPIPLEKFMGKYTHPAFGEYDFEIDEDGTQLIADARDRTFGFWLRLEHVGGLYFVAKMKDVQEDEDEEFGAEFRLGVDGNVKELGIDWENEEGSELYWLRKVA